MNFGCFDASKVGSRVENRGDGPTCSNLQASRAGLQLASLDVWFKLLRPCGQLPQTAASVHLLSFPEHTLQMGGCNTFELNSNPPAKPLLQHCTHCSPVPPRHLTSANCCQVSRMSASLTSLMAVGRAAERSFAKLSWRFRYISCTQQSLCNTMQKKSICRSPCSSFRWHGINLLRVAKFRLM